MATGNTRRLAISPGQRFGRGVVIEEVRKPLGVGRKTYRAARMQCDCGTIYETRLKDLFHATRPIRSCGCLAQETRSRNGTYARTQKHRDRMGAYRRSPEGRAASAAGFAAAAEANVAHGLARREAQHPLYSTWKGMMYRCYQPKCPGFENYGGRGIAVCERWHDVRLFVEDIMRLIGPRPEGMSLDRIDNDGPYAPGQVRWATDLEQAANSRLNRSAKLTAGKVLDIKRRLATGERPYLIARDYSVTNHCIYDIRDGKTWRSVQLPA